MNSASPIPAVLFHRALTFAICALIALTALGSAAIADVPGYTTTPALTDGFSRTVSGGWGSAGGSSYTTTPASKFAVDGSKGTISSVPAGGSASAILERSVGADQTVRVTFALPVLPGSGNGVYLSALLRVQGSGDAYRARVRVAPSGAMYVMISRSRGGSDTVVLAEQQMAGTVTAGAPFTLEVYAAGGSPVLGVRAWPDGAAVPGYRTATDSSSSAITTGGRVGLLAYVSSATQTSSVHVRSFALGTLAAGTAPTPAPSPPPATTSGAGSASVGTTAYAVPSNAIFVAVNGSDASTGTQSAPLRTVQKAVDRASSGQTIVVRAGTYHEAVQVPFKDVTIQSYPNEAVWFDGTVPVTGWTQSGSTWVSTGWKARFDHSASFTTGTNLAGFLQPAYPMAAHPDQVFFNGKALSQVASTVTPGPGQFSIDEAAGIIRVGSNPSGVAVRASDLVQAIWSVGRVTLRGFGVRGYATPVPMMGAIFVGGPSNGNVVENVVVTQNATQGISINSPQATVRSVTSDANGMTGIHASAAPGLVITKSRVTGNNTEHFPEKPSVAGIKVGRMSNVTITGNVVANNIGTTGIWTDENVIGFTIANNVVTISAGPYGIETEISDTGIVAGNEVSGARFGYVAYNTGNVRVIGNRFFDNSVYDLGITQDERRGKGPSAACPWVSKNITVLNNAFADNVAGNNRGFQFYVLDRATNMSADSMNITLNGNYFATAADGGSVSSIAWGAGDNTTLATYADPTAFPRAKTYGWVNYRGPLAARATVTQQGAVLPSDVAALLGLPAGSRRIGPPS